MTQIVLRCIYCGRGEEAGGAVWDAARYVFCADRPGCVSRAVSAFEADLALAEARERAEAKASGTLSEYLDAAADGTPGYDRYIRSRERRALGEFDWGVER